MNEFLIMLVAFAVGSGVSFLCSSFLPRLLNRLLTFKDRQRARSAETLNQYCHSRKPRSLNEIEIQELWSEAMNYVMSTESEARAEMYIQCVAKSLGDRGDTFITESREILANRFHKERQAVVVRDRSLVGSR